MGCCISCAIVRADLEERNRQLDTTRHPQAAEVQRFEHLALPEEEGPPTRLTAGALPE